MPDDTVRALAWAEYDFLAIDADLARLREKLSRAAGRVPSCAVAAKRIRVLRATLRQVLAAIDQDITAAVQAGQRTVA